jgi:hypothetical protein
MSQYSAFVISPLSRFVRMGNGWERAQLSLGLSLPNTYYIDSFVDDDAFVG